MAVCELPRRQISAGLAAVFLAVAVALLIDASRPRQKWLSLQLNRRWWGSASQGCWISQKNCVPYDSYDGEPEMWHDTNGDASQQQCFDVASKHWLYCLDPVNGFVAAAFLRRGSEARIQMWPEDAPQDHPQLFTPVTATLGGSLQLLNPAAGGVPWNLEICSHGPCWSLLVSHLCDGPLPGSSQTGGGAVALRTSCRQVLDGSWPGECEFGVSPSVCEDAARDAEKMREACDGLCGQGPVAHICFALSWWTSLIALIVACFVFSRKGRWRKRTGGLMGLVTGLAAPLMASTLVLLLVSNVRGALEGSAALKGHGGWEFGLGATQAIIAAVCSLLAALLIVDSSRHNRISKYEERERLQAYQEFNDRIKESKNEKVALSQQHNGASHAWATEDDSNYEEDGEQVSFAEHGLIPMADGTLLRAPLPVCQKGPISEWHLQNQNEEPEEPQLWGEEPQLWGKPSHSTSGSFAANENKDAVPPKRIPPPLELD